MWVTILLFSHPRALRECKNGQRRVRAHSHELNPGLAKVLVKPPRVPCAKGVSSQTSYDYVVFIFPHRIQVNLSDVINKNHPLGGNLFAQCSSELNPGLEPGDATASRWDHI